MAVETATKISELNKLWPLGTDAKSEGDDHIRLIKSALLATDGGALTGIKLTVATASGTWTKPAGLKYLEVWCVGGGGGGSRAGITGAGQSSVGGSGGGGGTAYRLYTAAELNATEAYIVGAGGLSPGGVAAAGGNSTFKGMTGNGGGAGATPLPATATLGINVAGGAGGNAVGGQINMLGEGADMSVANPHGRVGAAEFGKPGGSFFSRSLLQANLTAGLFDGAPGYFPGVGAMGGAAGASQATPGTGAVGGGGAVILKEYI